jgi:hypothetical protein
VIKQHVAHSRVGLVGEVEAVPHCAPRTRKLLHVVGVPERVDHLKVLANQQDFEEVEALDAVHGRVGLAHLNERPHLEHRAFVEALALQIDHLELLAQLKRGRKVTRRLACPSTHQLVEGAQLCLVVPLHPPEVVPLGKPELPFGVCSTLLLAAPVLPVIELDGMLDLIRRKKLIKKAS